MNSYMSNPSFAHINSWHGELFGWEGNGAILLLHTYKIGKESYLVELAHTYIHAPFGFPLIKNWWGNKVKHLGRESQRVNIEIILAFPMGVDQEVLMKACCTH